MTREIIIEPGATTGKQYDFEYDLCGNILSKTESTYTVATGAITGSTTKQYAYNDGTWKDLLSAYGTRYFTYDEIGNLRSLKNGSNTSGYYFNWGKGRQLESLTYGETAESADLYFEYGYNADGIRISKAILGRKLEYIVDGDKILKQVGCGVGVLQTLEFYYDALGEIIGFNYANQDYYFGKNLQGDVVELYQDGTLIATYEYDAWGKLLSIKDANGVAIADDINSRHVASINPIRYRGYYYDLEKKMYYLNSRYYYPEIGRFISADGFISNVGGDIRGYNLFTYCINNPVNMSDSSGSWPSWEDFKEGFYDVLETKVDVFVKSTVFAINPIGTIVGVYAHYNRNAFNKTDYSKEELGEALPESDSKFHQNNQKDNKPNEKFVVGDWFSDEVVYYSDGTINETPEDIGTFNVYYGDNDLLNIFVHGLFDVVPYIIWGNNSDDSTTIVDRVIKIFE